MATRRSVLTSLVGAGSALALPTIARAQDRYPNKPIKLIVPFPPGGPTDTIARMTAQDLSNRIGQVVVENRPGAGSTMATKDVAAADPDGYTLLLGTSGSLAVAPAPELFGAEATGTASACDPPAPTPLAAPSTVVAG